MGLPLVWENQRIRPAWDHVRALAWDWLYYGYTDMPDWMKIIGTPTTGEMIVTALRMTTTGGKPGQSHRGPVVERVVLLDYERGFPVERS